MRTFKQQRWAIDLLANWDAEVGRHNVAVFNTEDGVGALQLSSYGKPDGSPVQAEELLNLADLTVDQVEPVSCGEFSGFYREHSEKDTFWRRWWMAHGPAILFVTYNCEPNFIDRERAQVDGMMQTLRAK